MLPLNDPRQLLSILLKHRVVFVVAFLATALTVLVLTLMRTPVYEATGALLVQLGRDTRSQPAVGDRPSVLNRDPEAVLNTLLHILSSRDLVSDVVERVGPETLYPGLAESGLGDVEKRSAAIERFGKSYSAQVSPASSVLQVAYRHPDPALADLGLSGAVEVFKERHLTTLGNPQVPPFLEEKVADFRARLEASEEDLEIFVLADETLYLEEHGRLLIEQRGRLEAQFTESSNRIAGLERQIGFLGGQLYDPQTKALADARAQESRVIQSARLDLLNLQVEEKRLLGSYSESSRRVTAVREQIKTIEQFLEEQEELIGRGGVADDLAEQLTALRADLSFEMARGEGLAEQMAWLDRRLAWLPVRTKEYRELVRERDLNEQTYRTYLNQLEEARLFEELNQQQISSVSTIQSVHVGADPVSPNRKVRLLVGLLLGAVVGAAAALAAELRERRQDQPSPLENGKAWTPRSAQRA